MGRGNGKGTGGLATMGCVLICMSVVAAGVAAYYFFVIEGGKGTDAFFKRGDSPGPYPPEKGGGPGPGEAPVDPPGSIGEDDDDDDDDDDPVATTDEDEDEDDDDDEPIDDDTGDEAGL